MEVLTSEQMRQADNYTIANVPIASIELMENAARKCFDWFVQSIDKENFIHIFCGPGNNGGDGLALARMLHKTNYRVRATLLKHSDTLSADCLTNLNRAKSIDNLLVDEIETAPDYIDFPSGTIIIDALFGTGLTRNVEGEAGKLIGLMNNSGHPIISIDLPSGIRSDETSLLAGNEIIKASKTLTFQYLKPALLVAENEHFCGDVETLDIGLLPDALKEMNINYHLIDFDFVQSLHKPKPAFSHKGTFGHGLLICGGPGKMGAAVLAAHAYLRSGAGLLTMMVPESGTDTIYTTTPEAMVLPYSDNNAAALFTVDHPFKAIGAGPGLGTHKRARNLVDQLLSEFHSPLVLDADALNLISMNPAWMNRIPANSIITPHPGEFKRLFGEWDNDFEKLNLQKEMAMKHNIYLILKGKNTTIACPDGNIWFNPTGNPGMAKGGSGDVLTGLLTGLLTSGYHSFEAAILGVYIHGLAGDLAANELSQEGMTAGDIIRYLPEVWKQVIDAL